MNRENSDVPQSPDSGVRCRTCYRSEIHGGQPAPASEHCEPLRLIPNWHLYPVPAGQGQFYKGIICVQITRIYFFAVEISPTSLELVHESFCYQLVDGHSYRFSADTQLPAERIFRRQTLVPGKFVFVNISQKPAINLIGFFSTAESMGKRSFSVGDSGAAAFRVLNPVQQTFTKFRLDRSICRIRDHYCSAANGSFCIS